MKTLMAFWISVGLIFTAQAARAQQSVVCRDQGACARGNGTWQSEDGGFCACFTREESGFRIEYAQDTDDATGCSCVAMSATQITPPAAAPAPVAPAPAMVLNPRLQQYLELKRQGVCGCGNAPADSRDECQAIGGRWSRSRRDGSICNDCPPGTPGTLGTKAIPAQQRRRRAQAPPPAPVTAPPPAAAVAASASVAAQPPALDPTVQALMDALAIALRHGGTVDADLLEAIRHRFAATDAQIRVALAAAEQAQAAADEAARRGAAEAEAALARADQAHQHAEDAGSRATVAGRAAEDAHTVADDLRRDVNRLKRDVRPRRGRESRRRPVVGVDGFGGFHFVDNNRTDLLPAVSAGARISVLDARAIGLFVGADYITTGPVDAFMVSGGVQFRLDDQVRLRVGGNYASVGTDGRSGTDRFHGLGPAAEAVVNLFEVTRGAYGALLFGGSIYPPRGNSSQGTGSDWAKAAWLAFALHGEPF